MSPLCFFVGILSVGMMILGTASVSGQDYPNKPVRILAGSAGGGGDFVARIVAQGITGPLGQPVIVDNRGSGVLAAGIVAKAPPDGYSLLVSGGSFWINPLLQKAPYDPVKDFSPLSLLVREINVLVVHPSVAAKSIKELIALAKARPGALNYASIAVGSSQHLGTELFKSMAGVNLVHVPYKGGGPSLAALIADEVQVHISDLGLAAPHIKAGKIRALAITSSTPSALAPGLPTVAADLPGFEVIGVTGIWATGGTPGTIISRLNREMVRAINVPDVKERFLNAAVEVVGTSAEQFASFIKSDIATMSKVIKDAGIKIN